MCHLAGEMIDRIMTKQPELLLEQSNGGSSDLDRENLSHLIRVAGLCHDLGHGPFSHVFDNEFIPRVRPNVEWTHEQASVMMLDHMIEENGLEYDADDRTLIKDLIMGEKYVHGSKQLNNSGEESSSASSDHAIPKRHEYMYGKDESKFLWQIVANKTNSVDVDKFDYLARDSYNLGLKTSYDFTRIMKYCRVIDGEICYPQKEAYNLYEMFHTRYSLHKLIYTHRVGKAVEYMLTDALIAADRHLKISECIHQPEEYLHLTDCLLRQIEASKDPELTESRNIIRRLRTRDLYKFVHEILLYPTFSHMKVTEETILDHQDSNFKNLTKEDIIVHDLKINYAMKDRNPVDYCKFYRSGTEKSFYLQKDPVSLLIPDKFQERFIRLYVRDANNMEAARVAFKKWKKSLKTQGATPKSVKTKTPRSEDTRRSPVPGVARNLNATFDQIDDELKL